MGAGDPDEGSVLPAGCGSLTTGLWVQMAGGTHWMGPMILCPQAPSGWIMCGVGAAKAPWQSVPTMAGASVTATMARMLVWCAQDST